MLEDWNMKNDEKFLLERIQRFIWPGNFDYFFLKNDVEKFVELLTAHNYLQVYI